MLLPNKLFSYSETALSKIPYVLEVLDEPLSPSEILHSIDGVLERSFGINRCTRHSLCTG